MNRNNRQDTAFYKSQVGKTPCPAHNSRLYTSNAHPQPTVASIRSYNLNQLIPSRVSSKAERAIDSISNSTHFKGLQYERGLLSRNRSTQNFRWQSPTRGEGSMGFKSIIQEINENNDKTLDQLDTDLRRIKNSINQVQEQIHLQKKTTESQALYEQIQLLQEENERLREKNLQLLDEKKKLGTSLEQCELLIQKQMSKRQGSENSYSRQSEETVKSIKERIEIEKKLKEKNQECEDLRQENVSLVKLKNLFEKKESVYISDKAKLNKNIADLQKQMDSLKLGFQDNLTTELQKKDNYFFNIIKIHEKQYEQNIKSAKSNTKEETETEIASVLREKDSQIQSFQSEMVKIKAKEAQRQDKIKELSQKNKLSQQTIDSLKNQNQFLSFSHEQIKDQLHQKERQIQSIKQTATKSNDELSVSQSQTSGAKLQYQQLKNRYCLLQELYNRLEKESNQYENISQQHLNGYKQELHRAQEEINRLRLQFSSLNEDYKELEYRLQESNQHHDSLTFQINKKSEEILSLKQQNLSLLHEQKYSKMQSTYHSPFVSPPKYQRRERINSGDFKPNFYELREQEKNQTAKIKAMERQLNTLMKQCKASYQNQKSLFKKKEKQYRDTIQTQKRQINEMATKTDTLQKDYQKEALAKLRREQDLLNTLQKKQEQVVQYETKYKHLAIELNRLQCQHQGLKSQRDDLKLNILKIQSSHSKETMKIQQIKSQMTNFIQSIVKQLKNVLSFSRETYTHNFDLYSDMKQINFISDIRVISNLNFSLHSLKQMISSSTKKIKKLQQQKQLCSQLYSKLQQQKNDEIKRSSIRSEVVSPNRKQKKSNQSDGNEMKDLWVKDLMVRLHELEKQVQMKNLANGKLNLELEEEKQTVAVLESRLSKLKDQIDILQTDNQVKDKKLKECQEELLAKVNRQVIQSEKNFLHNFVTPTKDNPNHQSTMSRFQNFQERQIRQRVRSARHQSPLSKRQIDFNTESTRLIELQLANTSLKRSLEQKDEEIMNLKKFKRDQTARCKQAKDKIEERQTQLMEMESILEEYNRQRKISQSKIAYLQTDIATLTSKVQQLTERCNQQWTQLVNANEHQSSLQNNFKAQRQILQKTYKAKLLDKDTKTITSTQKLQLKIVQFQSQIAHLKQAQSQLLIKNQQLLSKNAKLLTETSNLKQKESSQQITMKKLQLKLQEEQRERQKLLQTFRMNTQRLTKVLEEREIQIEELKFIQESTVINFEYAKNQHKKQQNQSLFSFQYDQ